nr:hypothetical protein TetV2_00552 [Oceanusvirus sp.]
MAVIHFIELLNELGASITNKKTPVTALLAKAMELDVTPETLADNEGTKKYVKQYEQYLEDNIPAPPGAESNDSSDSESGSDSDSDSDSDSSDSDADEANEEEQQEQRAPQKPASEPIQTAKTKSANPDKVALVGVLTQLAEQLGCKRGCKPCMSWSNAKLMVWIIVTCETTSLEWLETHVSAKYFQKIKDSLLHSINIASIVDRLDAKGYEPSEDHTRDDKAQADKLVFVTALQAVCNHLGGKANFKRGSYPVKSWNESQLIIWFMEVYRCPGLGLEVESWVTQLPDKYAKKVDGCHKMAIKVKGAITAYRKASIKAMVPNA